MKTKVLFVNGPLDGLIREVPPEQTIPAILEGWPDGYYRQRTPSEEGKSSYPEDTRAKLEALATEGETPVSFIWKPKSKA